MFYEILCHLVVTEADINCCLEDLKGEKMIFLEMKFSF